MFNFFSTQALSDGYSFENILFNLVLSFLLSISAAIVYKKTHRGLSYSQAFVFSLVLMGVVISSVMMVIGNNIARAFGAFGAFSLVRFRTAIKDSRDLAYIFVSLALGMAVGTNNYIIALVTAPFLMAVIIVLTKFNFGSVRKYDYILTFLLKSGNDSKTDVYREMFEEYLKLSDLLNINTLKGGKLLELSFSVRFFDEAQKSEFVGKMNTVRSISEVNLIAAKNDIEY